MTGGWALGIGGWRLWALDRGAGCWTLGIRGWMLKTEMFEEICPESGDEDWGAGGWALDDGEWMPEPEEDEDWGAQSADEDWGAGGWALGTCGWMLETGKQRRKTEEFENRVWVLRIDDQSQRTLY